jgi:hypothetical protein
VKQSEWERLLIFSDAHSVFLDRKAWSVFLQACEIFRPDRVISNGDILDCVGISDHASKIALFQPEFINDYPFEYELDFTIEEILKPLRKAIGQDAKILLRLGNHEQRFMRPSRMNAKAMADILETITKRGCHKLEDLLKLSSPSINATLSYNGVDVLYKTFTLVHGVKTGQGAAKANLLRYGSGTSGHSHRVNSYTQVMQGTLQGWWESACMRTTSKIEYLPHGDSPDWANGFLSLVINKNTGKFFCTPHLIIKGQCDFMGQILTA